MKQGSATDTKDLAYASRLLARESKWWKRLLDVQAPFRWNLRRLNPGFTLDIGCGIGRNLINLNGNGIGVDHNEHSVEIAKSRGLKAFTPEDFNKSSYNQPNSFDSILLAHVAEHMTEAEAVSLLAAYLYLLKPQGQVILITPQELGFRADPSHVQFIDFNAQNRILLKAGLISLREFSFPFPRFFGRFFKYNEFVSVSRRNL